MPLPTYLPHILYATALTSLSLHLLSTRKASVAVRQQADARISVLEGLAARLRAGEHVLSDEVARARRLLRDGDAEDARSGTRNAEAVERDVDWKAVLLGRADGSGKGEAKEAKDALQKEAEKQ